MRKTSKLDTYFIPGKPGEPEIGHATAIRSWDGSLYVETNVLDLIISLGNPFVGTSLFINVFGPGNLRPEQVYLKDPGLAWCW